MSVTAPAGLAFVDCGLSGMIWLDSYLRFIHWAKSSRMLLLQGLQLIMVLTTSCFACLWLAVLAKIHDTIAPPHADESQSRKSYELLGINVGRTCLCSVLGIGKNRLCKAAAGQIDTRFASNVPLHRTCPKARNVDKFLRQLHGTVAEIMPTGQESYPLFCQEGCFHHGVLGGFSFKY